MDFNERMAHSVKRAKRIIMKIKLKNKKLKTAMVSIALSSAFFLSSCAVPEEEPVIILEEGDDSLDYVLVTCTYDDIVATRKIECTYKKDDEQEVYFPVSGKVIDKVFVDVGSEVKKGDVLARLDIGSLEADIAYYEYSIRKNELQLGYIDEEETLSIEDMVLDCYVRKIINGEMLEARVEALKKQNEQKRQSLNDTLEFDRRKLAELRKEYAQSTVVAEFDGKVSEIEEKLEGSTSNIEKCIMKIVDNSEGFFETKDQEQSKYFTEGETVPMRIITGSGKGDYELIPDAMNEWGETQKFRIFSGDNAEELEAGVKGEIVFPVEKKENVLCLPKECIYKAGSDSYVYVLDDEGMRQVKWIETGLEGDEKVEIKSGLEDGEKVIRR